MPKSVPSIAGLTTAIASSVWGSGFELDDLSGTYGDDVVGSILNHNSDTPFDTHVTAIFVPFTPPDGTFYITSNLSEFDTMITQTANHQFSDSLGTIVTAFGTEHIYKVEMTGGLTVSGVLCADNSKRPFFIRFWNGDPALFVSPPQRRYNDFRYAVFKTTVGSMTSRIAKGFTGGYTSGDDTMIAGDLGTKTNANIGQSHIPDKPEWANMPDWPYGSHEEILEFVTDSRYREQE